MNDVLKKVNAALDAVDNIERNCVIIESEAEALNREVLVYKKERALILADLCSISDRLHEHPHSFQDKDIRGTLKIITAWIHKLRASHEKEKNNN